jgi:NMD protein affecting ribosome stability and mRNA decay
MGLMAITVLCEKCNEESDILVEREDRNEDQLCELCQGGFARRVWTAPNVSTSKTSESIPEAAASGRFDHLREQAANKRQLSEAKKRYVRDPTKTNKEDITKLRKEQKKIQGKD